MAFDLEKLLSTVEAASRAYKIVTELVSDAALTLSNEDQGALRIRLIALREENEKGFRSLDDRLAALIVQGGGDDQRA